MNIKFVKKTEMLNFRKVIILLRNISRTETKLKEILLPQGLKKKFLEEIIRRLNEEVIKNQNKLKELPLLTHSLRRDFDIIILYKEEISYSERIKQLNKKRYELIDLINDGRKELIKTPKTQKKGKETPKTIKEEANIIEKIDKINIKLKYSTIYYFEISYRKKIKILEEEMRKIEKQQKQIKEIEKKMILLNVIKKQFFLLKLITKSKNIDSINIDKINQLFHIFIIFIFKFLNIEFKIEDVKSLKITKDNIKNFMLNLSKVKKENINYSFLSIISYI